MRTVKRCFEAEPCSNTGAHSGDYSRWTIANIAHGCNSVTATKMALNLADYAITEAGFGADLGAEKFLDIKCRMAGFEAKCSCYRSNSTRSEIQRRRCKKRILNQENLEALEKVSRT